jgi:hypothetical protein
MNPNYVAIIKHNIDKLLIARFIQPIEEIIWLSPTVVVPKKDGKFKIYVTLEIIEILFVSNSQC